MAGSGGIAGAGEKQGAVKFFFAILGPSCNPRWSWVGIDGYNDHIDIVGNTTRFFMGIGSFIGIIAKFDGSWLR